MDKKILRTLRIGDTVRIHFDHFMFGLRGDARSRPFDVVIARFNDTGKAYKDVDGRYYESRQISWRWADMPVELQPNELHRDDVRGLDIAHEDHIIDIVARAPYQVRPQPRNYLYAGEQAGFLYHQKVEAYRKAKGERENSFARRHTQATGYRYEEYNETYGRNIKPGQYNGHLFNLAEVLIARRSQLAISDTLDPDRFYAAWNQAGRPGYAGPYQVTEFSPFMRDKGGARIDPSPFKALINRKAFTNWVVRNAPRFVMTKAQQMKNMIQAAIDEEEYMRKSMEDVFRRDYGGDDIDEFDSEDEDPQEAVAAAQGLRDTMRYIDGVDDEIDYHLTMQADEDVGD